MTTPSCLLEPFTASDGLARIRDELLRLRGRELGGCGTSLGWIHNQHACTLRNLRLSHSCLVLVLEGRKVLLHTGPEPLVVETGGLLFIPAGREISCANEPAKGGDYLALTLSFAPELLERVQRKAPVEARLLSGERLDTRKLAEDRKRLAASLETFLRLLPDDDDPSLPLMQQEQIAYLLWRLGVPVFTSQHYLLAHIRVLVENCPDAQWSAHGLAEHLHMSERTLRRQLERLGTSPSEQIRLGRLHRGLDLLMRADVRVGEVALSCGYSSQSRFAERFREQFGIPPGEVVASRQVRSVH